MTHYWELENQRAELDRHANNAARLAKAYARFRTTGQGTIEFEEEFEFGITFIEEPFISYGCQVDIDDLADQLGLDDGETPRLPQATGYVADWDTDNRGFYTGAFVAVVVQYPTGAGIPTDVEININHHFSFEAIAMKDIPLDARD